MVEKVVGFCRQCRKSFFGKRTQKYCSTNCYIKHKNNEAKKYKKKGITLEWLEKQKCLTEKTRPMADKKLDAYLQGRLDFYYDLIEAATKQVGEKT